MPNYNGRGPEGVGPMTGRGLGLCGGVTAMGPRYGRGMGRGYRPGYGLGPGYGRGLGRGAGWFAVGYNDAAVGADLNNALEQKRAFLLAELARTEALLGGKSASEAAQANKEAEK